MKLVEIVIKNFRSYKEEQRILISNLTAILGRNDIGKSTLLEALEIFFNNETVKIDSSDASVFNENKEVLIGCVFDEVDFDLILDSSFTTNLREEFLLNEKGLLEIHKIYDCNNKNPKESVFALAKHPNNENVKDILMLKNSELKKKIKDAGIDETSIDLRINSSMRKALWSSISEFSYVEEYIPLNKEDAKMIWDNLQLVLPIYALFQADRPSRDEDAEVQDPMKIAVIEAIKQVSKELEEIKSIVQQQVYDVAQRTLNKLREMDERLASELSPHFKSEPKWDSLFKLSLTGENDIPINKRGSGVRRLILLNFFRAEIDRKKNYQGRPVIYAIEEPETSQHPDYQLMIIKALLDLSEQENCQVILTTHVPGLAGQIPVENLRFVTIQDSKKVILMGNDHIYELIAKQLGVLPDINGIKVLFFVEGPHDISFFRMISKILNQKDSSIPNLYDDNRIAMIPLGGSSLKDWVQNRYLKSMGVPEVHIYDRDSEPPKYQRYCDTINERKDNSIAFITCKKEIENYIHPEAIKEVLEVEIAFTDHDDVPLILSKATGMNEGTIKKYLNNEVVQKMTYDQIVEMDTKNEFTAWFEEIKKRINILSAFENQHEAAVSKDKVI